MERPLLYYAAKLTGNTQMAYDVLQDVWVKVVGGIRGLKNPASLRPWLYRITHGLAVEQGRMELLKELKLVQLQILELHALFRTGGTMPGKS